MKQFMKKVLGKRNICGALAILLVVSTVINPLSMLPAYATGDWLQLSYQYNEKSDLELYVQAENGEDAVNAMFAPGDEVVLNLFVQNNSEQVLEGRGLSWKNKTTGFSDGEFILFDEGKEGAPEINENGNVVNLNLDPHEIYALQFVGTVDEDLDVLKERQVIFHVGAEYLDENGEGTGDVVTKDTYFQYTTGLVNDLSIDIDGAELVAGETDTLEIELNLADLGYYYETADDSDVETASDSDADEEEATGSNTVTASDNNAETASDNNAEEDDDDEEDYTFEINNIKFSLNTYGAKFENVSLVESTATASNAIINATVEYTVAEDTAEGTYFGTLGAAIKSGKKTYDVEVGFQFGVEEAATETLSPVDELFNRLMGCETYEELSEMMENMTDEEYALMNQFSDEQYAALMAWVQELQEYYFALLSNELDASKYNSSARVYWDTMNSTENGSGSSGSADTRISYVKLNSTDVVWSDSTYSASNGNGTKLSSYYENASTNNMKTTNLEITPASGYYVTKVVIACTGGFGGGETPYNCRTWADNNAFTASFGIDEAGKITIKDLSSINFSHRSGSKVYFILIKVAPIPSPLYVEYDYGIISDYVDEDSEKSAFAKANTWLALDSENKYGTGGIQTNYTQFKYAYDASLSEKDAAAAAAKWEHYANSITTSAKTEAANVGYYFAGWKAEYYGTTTATENSTGSYNNYTYTMTNSYGSGSYGEGDKVTLTTNVRLIAQWKPIELTVTKNVEGLTGTYITDHTYTLQVQKQNSSKGWDVFENVVLTVNGNGSASSNVTSTVTPGTYRVIETVGNTDLTSDPTTVMYVSVTDGGTCEFTIDGIIDGTTRSGSLSVLNEYSSTPAKQKLTLTKTVSGNLGDYNEKFTFNITYTESGATTGTTKEVELMHNESVTIEVPYNASVTIVETVPTGYEFSVTSVLDNEKVEVLYTTNGAEVTFTMPAKAVNVTVNNEKEAIIDTGITMDSIPCILILVAVIGGVTFYVIRKRKDTDLD